MERTATTDDRGDAKFVVSPGVYVARLTITCAGGIYPQTLRVPHDGTARVRPGAPG